MGIEPAGVAPGSRTSGVSSWALSLRRIRVRINMFLGAKSGYERQQVRALGSQRAGTGGIADSKACRLGASQTRCPIDAGRIVRLGFMTLAMV